MPARALQQIGNGLLTSAAHWVFFTLAPPRRAPGLYCAGMALGFGLVEIQHHILFSGTDGLAIFADFPYHRLAILSTVVLGTVILIGSIAVMYERRKPALRFNTEPVPADAPVPWLSATIVASNAFLFLLHGLSNNSFLLHIGSITRIRTADAISAIVCVLFFGLGAILCMRHFSTRFHGLAFACGVAHLAVPTLALFPVTATGVRILYTVIGPFQNLYVALAVTALAMTAPARWRILVLTMPLVLRVFSIFVVPFALRNISRQGEILPLAMVVTAVCFYAVCQRIRLTGSPTLHAATLPGEAFGAPPSVSDVPHVIPPIRDDAPEPDDAPSPLAELADPGIVRVIEDLSVAYGFSAREREVATLLSSGMTPDAIGEALSLSTNTVNTYVRRVVLKTGRKGRRDFIAMVTGAGDAEE